VFYKNVQEDDVVTDPALLALAGAGADKTCPACRQDNGGQATFCGHCGSPMNGATPRPVQVQRPEDIPTSGEPPMVRPEPAYSEPPEPIYPRSTRFPQHPWENLPGLATIWPWLLVGGIIVLGVILGIFWFKTSTVPVTVSGFSWSRTISFEEYRTITEEGWSYPSDARNIRSERRISGYHQEPDGYETVQVPYQEKVGEREYKCGERDLGNGYSEDVYCTDDIYETRYKDEQRQKYKDVPDYADWYTYEVDRWVPGRSVAASANDHNPYDPSYSLGSKERVSGRSETYVAYFTAEDGKTYQLGLDYNTWAEMHLNQLFNGKVNAFDVLIAIEPPE